MNTVLTGRAQDRHTAALRQVPQTQQDFLARLRQSAPDWVWGCERCDMGFLNLEAPVFDIPRQEKVARHLAGLLDLCDCMAGQMVAKSIERQLNRASEESEADRIAIAAARERRIARLFEYGPVPARFANLSFSKYVHMVEKAKDTGKYELIRLVKEYQRTEQVVTPEGVRYGILAYGPTDQGKTGALSPLFHYFVSQGHTGLWAQYNDLLAAMKQFEDGKVEERIGACKDVEYLFIDDFGDPAADNAATNYARDVIFRIIDHRNNFQKSTFVTSNLHPEKMERQFHERTAKRLQELCAIVEVKGKPMRELLKGTA